MHPNRQVRVLALQVLFLWDVQASADEATAEQALSRGTVLDAPERDPVPAGAPAAVPAGASGTAPRRSRALVPALDPTVRAKAMSWARGAWDERSLTDARVEYHAPQWPPKRQPGVDRAILRLAGWELRHGTAEPKVVIDEAIELARLYSTENSPAFVNAVLDALRKELVAATGG